MADLPDVDFDEVDFAFEDHPRLHTVLEDLRTAEAYAVVPFAGAKAILLLTDELVSAAFKDESTFPASAIYPMTTGPVLGKTLQCMAGAEHRKNRTLILPPFRRRQVAEYVAPLLEPLAHELIDRFASNGEADLVTEFTTRYAVLLISRLMGLPVDDEATVHRWAHDLFHFPFDPEAAMRASHDFTDAVRPLVAERRHSPGDDLISVLVSADLEGERLDDEEVLSFLRLLFPAGADTTMLGLGNILSALLTHPEQLAILRSEIREHAIWAVWEGLRWEPPVGLLPRLCPTATTWNGIGIPARTPVIFSINAANRDPLVYPNPHTFDITRRAPALLSFGHGPHSCAGNWLALAELETALTALFERLPGLRLQYGAEGDAMVTSQVGVALRGPNRLTVEWDS
ncbi:cytochrome P450 [Rhodococcus gordoniae]|uniref:cytochrome P450 n=1 Tax=Rhodococcus gordoniae TaxID=223392 RepID=UPI001FD776F0|nr:cytochrome P450 [Rhodococcus gordoniae]